MKRVPEFIKMKTGCCRGTGVGSKAQTLINMRFACEKSATGSLVTHSLFYSEEKSGGKFK